MRPPQPPGARRHSRHRHRHRHVPGALSGAAWARTAPRRGLGSPGHFRGDPPCAPGRVRAADRQTLRVGRGASGRAVGAAAAAGSAGAGAAAGP